MSDLPHAIDTLIIGAGLAGLSTALHHTDHGKVVVVEAAAQVGGMASTEQIDGFTFDVTGHWLHLRDPDMRALALGLLGAEHFTEIERMSRIWSHGTYTRYPFQANVHGLPAEVVKDCIMGAIEADRTGDVALADEPENFGDWIRFYFGEGIAEHFMVPYNAKLWGVPVEEITSRWCQRFVPRPKLEDIVAGAVGCNAGQMGYNARFLYPKVGGIQSLVEALADAVGRGRIHLNQRVVSVDLEAKVAHFEGGATVGFTHLVNTMPLTNFVDLMVNVPVEVKAARAKLRAADTVYLNVGIDGALGQPDHWIYVPEREWPFYRVGSFSNAWPAMAPEGCANLYVELSDRETPLEVLRPRIIEGLVAMGLISSPEQVRFMHRRIARQAYVIYDFNYHKSRAVVHAWLAKTSAQSIGRYGDWNYSSMEDALLEGRATAARLVAR